MKYQANKLSAILTGWADYEKMLVDYSEGLGSAAVEAEKSATNWEGSANRLSNSFTDLISNFVDSGTVINGLNGLNALVSGFDKLTESIGNFATIGGAIGAFTSVHGVG